MESVVKVYPNTYYDSVQLMFITSAVKKKEGIDTALVAMGTQANKDIFRDIGMEMDRITSAGPNDMIIGVRGEAKATCDQAIEEAKALLAGNGSAEIKQETTYRNIEAAVRAAGKANLCVISVPGEYAKAEAMKALHAGLHTLIFSDNVPLEDEREIKLLAKEKGLLCMGPDCGVANINGLSFLVGSIVRKGPIGICAASGVGLQQVAVLIHEAGSGVSQGIGTGGKDLRDKVGGITMLMGIDKLEKDDETKAIVLISRKPEQKTLQEVLKRVKTCRKPTVICFVGCEKEIIEQTGAVHARNLEDAARKALRLMDLDLPGEDAEMNAELVEAYIRTMSKEQKYVRGLYCGGTFVEEAMSAMKAQVGNIYSNAPLKEELKLEHSMISYQNTVVDYGDEEFTKNRPHPVIDLEPRNAGIIREAKDPEVAVLLLDFVLGPAVHDNPAGFALDAIKTAMRMAEERGSKLAVIASVCGTELDPQKRSCQEKLLRDAGVIVCADNYQAAVLAGTIVKRLRER